MDTTSHSNAHTLSGTVGGTVVVLFIQLPVAEIAKTVALAAIGATVSFIISLLLKWAVRYLKKKRSP